LGLGYLILGVFSGVVAALPWPGKQVSDLALWVLFAVVLLVLGARLVDRASKQEDKAGEPPLSG
jgi:membrane protein implicated in regulation of membrane protease activity